jgi:hypothetical protein
VHGGISTRLASSPSGSRLAQLAFPGNPLMLFICAFDAVFIFAAVVRELFNHFIDAAGHIATDCRLEHYALTDMEFMRRRGHSDLYTESRSRRLMQSAPTRRSLTTAGT